MTDTSFSEIVEPTSAPTPARAPWLSAATLAAGYFLIAGLYVVTSSQLAGERAGSIEELEQVELLKGLAFVLVTAVTLYFLNLWQLNRLRAHTDERARRDRVMHNAERSILAGTFARGVAHDINNGLTVAQFALEELRQHVAKDAELDALTADVQEAIVQIHSWNRRFFELGDTRLFGEAQEFDLAIELRNTAKLARRHDHMRQVTVEVDVPETLPFRGRQALLQRAILNLLLNAAEAAGPSSCVQLAVSPVAGGQFRITVSDDGPGIPPDQRTRILEPFYTTKASGTGLGLASVVACASVHSGRVEIDDSPLGGARFSLFLRG
jgi:signal transduction histidine kinase